MPRNIEINPKITTHPNAICPNCSMDPNHLFASLRLSSYHPFPLQYELEMLAVEGLSGLAFCPAEEFTRTMSRAEHISCPNPVGLPTKLWTFPSLAYLAGSKLLHMELHLVLADTRFFLAGDINILGRTLMYQHIASACGA